jgi:hypothetical protein
MAAYAFGAVIEDGFISFTTDLAEGEWSLIDTSTYEGPGRTALKPLCDAPAAVVWKLQLSWAIGALIAAKAGAAGAKDCDKAWDTIQKRIKALLSVALTDADPQKRAAAERLQKGLLLGAGTAQTNLNYHQEVDFARKQLVTVSEGQPAADVALLGLAPTMAEVAATTDALAVAIGHGEGDDRPSERVRAALSACSATFGAVATQIAHLTTKGQVGADRERAQDLLKPLAALLARYAPAAAAPAAPADPPAGP